MTKASLLGFQFQRAESIMAGRHGRRQLEKKAERQTGNGTWALNSQSLPIVKCFLQHYPPAKGTMAVLKAPGPGDQVFKSLSIGRTFSFRLKHSNPNVHIVETM